MHNNYEKIILFDTETTGLDFKNDDITQFGILVLKKTESGAYKMDKELNFFIKTDKIIPEEVVKITKIDNALLEKEGITKEAAFDIIKDIFLDKNSLIMAYNIIFDMNMLTNFIKRFIPTYEFENDILDVLSIYKDFYDFPHKLENAVKNLEVEIQNTHRAIDDVKATLMVLNELKERNNLELDKYINILSVNPKYGVPKDSINLDKYTIVKHPYNTKKFIYNRDYLEK